MYIASEKDPPRMRSYPLLGFLFRVPLRIPVSGGRGAVSAAAVPSSRRRTASSPGASASACTVIPAGSLSRGRLRRTGLGLQVSGKSPMGA